jgi:histone-lysine N-methyltransferase SETD3
MSTTNPVPESQISSASKYSTFESWLTSNNSHFPKLELRSYATSEPSKTDAQVASVEEDKKETVQEDEDDSEMRGVHAKATVLANEVCVSVPRSCLITVEVSEVANRNYYYYTILTHPHTHTRAHTHTHTHTLASHPSFRFARLAQMGKATPIGRLISAANLDLDAPKHVYLMIYLLCDRLSPTSFFKPYYDILPPTLSNMPIFWSNDELQLLKGSYLVEQIRDRIVAIEEDYAAILQVAPELATIATLDEFKWARMCVCSRNFGLVINGVRTSALVPHADMLNHYRPRETKWTFDNETQCFTITALQDIQAGDQIYDSYGQKCNHRFLLNYGFAVEDNRESDGFCPNEVSIELTLDEPANRSPAAQNDDDDDEHLTSKETSKQQPPSDFASTKYAFWVRDGPPSSKRIRVCVSNNDSTKSLFSMLRVLEANEEDMAAIVAAGPYMYRSCRDVRFALSSANERRALGRLQAIVTDALAQYPTTMAEDDERLARDGLLPPFSNARHAYIQVRGEKEVLHHFLQLCKCGVEALDAVGDDEFDNKVRDIQEQHGGCISQYVKDVVASVRREEARKERLRRKQKEEEVVVVSAESGGAAGTDGEDVEATETAEGALR